MGRNRVFFPQLVLDRWIAEDQVVLRGDELRFPREGRRYRIAEAVRILAEVSGTEDPFELVGRVKSLAFLRELGAEVLECSMVLEDLGYDVVPGFVGVPLPPESEAEARAWQAEAARRSLTDEDLLAEFLIQRL